MYGRHLAAGRSDSKKLASYGFLAPPGESKAESKLIGARESDKVVKSKTALMQLGYKG